MRKVLALHKALNTSGYIDVTAFVRSKFQERYSTAAVGTYNTHNLGAWDNKVPCMPTLILSQPLRTPFWKVLFSAMQVTIHGGDGVIPP